MPTDDELSVTFAALSDPTRRAILARLAHGEATVLELAEPFQYREIVRPDRIVWTFEYEGLPGRISVDTMVFQEIEQAERRRTRITSTTVFASIEDRDGMLQSGMAQGASESYERLANYLHTLG
jgi:uncharacterized protein YndB with AHSA1/START domain